MQNHSLIQSNVDLQNKHTMASPAHAQHYAMATSIEELISICRSAKSQAWPLKILGEGSNVLLPKNVNALVLQLQLNGIECLNQDRQNIELKVSASENWHQLILYCQKQAYFGLENLTSIPGSVGAAPVQNIGAYGVEVADFITQVEFFNPDTEQLHTVSACECGFSYRDSEFKSGKLQHVIITAVTFKLSKQFTFNDQYSGLKGLSLEGINDDSEKSRSVIKFVESIRWSKLPKPDSIPNAGSFFKNPVITASHFLQLKQRYPAIVSFKNNQGVKIPAAWLIDQLGFKQQIHQQGVTCYHHQALVLINPNRAGLEAVLEFAFRIQQLVQLHYQIELEIEPQIIK